MNDRPPYRYSPLSDPKKIRILRLYGGDSPVLYADLFESPISGDVSYEALSYRWQSPEPSHSLLVTNGTTLRITASLFEALCAVRRAKPEHGIRHVWADAACVNQEDVGERGRQVKLMTEVFSRASRVITYVGGDTAEVNRGIRLANKLVLAGKEHTTDPTTTLSTLFAKYRVPDQHDVAWVSLRDLVLRGWYTRLWMVQECLLAKSRIVLCGKVEVSWDVFTRVAEMYRTNALDGPKPSASQVEALGLMPRIGELLRLDLKMPLKTLAFCRDLDCSDPRDRVFALSSVCLDGRIMPDYTKTTAQVYQETADLLLSRCGLELLSYAGIRRSQGIPSWIPDWSARTNQYPVLHFTLTDASAGLEAEMPPSPLVSGPLVLSGLVHDRIVHVTDTLRTTLGGRLARYDWARQQHMRLVASGRSYLGGGTHVEAFWRTLVCDSNVVGSLAGAAASAPGELLQALRQFQTRGGQSSLGAQFEAYFRPPEDLDLENIFSSLRQNGAADDDGDSYHQAVVRAGNLDRRLFTTQRGYIGMASSDAGINDAVAFFPGARVPFVVRPQSKPSHYELVGDCFVYGLMRGEASSARRVMSVMILV